ncbi:MAG: hypothetical protein ABFD69_08785 [Candidatus Sumerlaeia bacterium]
MLTFQDILIFSGCFGFIVLLMAAFRNFGLFSYPMAISLRRWWPAWFVFYSLLLTGSIAVLVASFYTGPMSSMNRGLAIAYLGIFSLHVIWFWLVLFTNQPREQFEFECPDMDFYARRDYCRQLAAGLTRQIELDIFRKSSRSRAYRLLLVNRQSFFGIMDPYGVLLEAPRDEIVIRVHCISFNTSTGKELDCERSMTKLNCVQVADALSQLGARIDIQAVYRKLGMVDEESVEAPV